jgi:quercetin dioxygenase-like cupin family protein
MPAGFEVPPHTHDISEHMTVLDGALHVSDGTVLGPGDTVVIPADHLYGFTVGDEGVRFLVVRAADAATQFTGNQE